ncbi:hypothetical protein B7494_g4933 [Chlorociboria aeruginascens]|nr:hypothetical protein B7494_g4933 [Chlorociboria aeruginascens]
MESAAKRRKTSPTTSIPVDAPNTPRRIPIRSQNLPSKRPSFASPTKASIARHNPQLLARATFSGNNAERPGSRGSLQDGSDMALGIKQPTVIDDNERPGPQLTSNSQENGGLQRSGTPGTDVFGRRRSPRLTEGGLSMKPRQISRSPIKRPQEKFSEGSENQAAKALEENPNPFRKTGLRRSPIATQKSDVVQEESVQQDENPPDPFVKRGLRRSPVSSQPIDILPASEPQTNISTTPIQPPVIQPVEFASLENPHQEENPEPPQASTTSTQQPPADLPVGAYQRQGVPEPISEPLPKAQVQPATELNVPGTSREGDDPELPLTPTQRGLTNPIVTTPLTGIHNTPSKGPRKSKALAEKLKSSPLKPQAPPPPQPAKEPQSGLQVVPQPKFQKGKEVERRKSARFSIPADPHAAKRKIRDDLLKELQQLQADVALANQENERLFSQHEARITIPQDTSNIDAIRDLLLRSAASEPPPEPLLKPPGAFEAADLFLPFVSLRKPQPVLPPVVKSLPSYESIVSADPLAQLKNFTPLHFSSKISLLPPVSLSPDSSQDPTPPTFQKHHVSAGHRSGLFAARLSMIVDTNSFSISELDIERLDPSAEAELGTFMRKRAKMDGPLGKDIGVVCWAMGRWVETSILRAKFWCTVDKELSNAEVRTKTLHRLAEKRKQKRRHERATEEVEAEEPQKGKWTRKELLPHMGRTSMEVLADDVELRLEWKIGFDWTGEVESSLSACARLPTFCKSPLPLR